MDEWLGLIGWLGAVNLVRSTGGFDVVNGDVVKVSQDCNGKPTVRRPS